jgi:hypothetical protein
LATPTVAIAPADKTAAPAPAPGEEAKTPPRAAAEHEQPAPQGKVTQDDIDILELEEPKHFAIKGRFTNRDVFVRLIGVVHDTVGCSSITSTIRKWECFCCLSVLFCSAAGFLAVFRQLTPPRCRTRSQFARTQYSHGASRPAGLVSCVLRRSASGAVYCVVSAVCDVFLLSVWCRPGLLCTTLLAWCCHVGGSLPFAGTGRRKAPQRAQARSLIPFKSRRCVAQLTALIPYRTIPYHTVPFHSIHLPAWS